ncbi:hypothetical protein [Agrobacterium sp.]|jgi:hypothetical protein|uniref:hypothetical protein n=1 Tax=Agrobacterium sp. TaxID=361 RepID=UPI0028A64270
MRRFALLSTAAVVVCVTGLMIMTSAISTPSSSEEPTVYPLLPAPGEMDAKRHIFVSGHSLTPRPMLEFMSQISAAVEMPIVWNGQNLNGSSIKDRSFGGAESGAWTGFDTGTDANGETTDALAEMQSPSKADAGKYDILLITEQHRLLDSLLWQQTGTYLRAYQERFIQSNPEGEVFFFTPWISLSDKNNARDWIEYERAAMPVWQCVVAKVNDQPLNQGPAHPIRIVPASLALADLVDHLIANPSTSGFAHESPRKIVDTFFEDDVHLTAAGNYFIAALTFQAIYGELKADDIPSSLSDEKARTLRKLAADFLARYRTDNPTFDREACGERPSLSFIFKYTGYIERTYVRPEKGYVAANVQRFRDMLRFMRQL